MYLFGQSVPTDPQMTEFYIIPMQYCHWRGGTLLASPALFSEFSNRHPPPLETLFPKYTLPSSTFACAVSP